MPALVTGAIDIGAGLFGGAEGAGALGGIGGLEGALGGLGTDLAGLFGGGAEASIAGAAPTALPAAGGDLTGGALGFTDTGALGGTAGGGAPDAISGALGLPSTTDTSALSLGAPTPGTPDLPTIPGQVGPNAGGQAGSDIQALIGGGSGSPAGAPGGGGSANVLQQLMTDPLGTLGQGAAKSVVNNPLGIGLAAGGMGLNLINSNKNNPLNTREGVALSQDASRLDAQGQMLQSYLTSGTLPPALQTQLTQATQAAKATIISRYAQQGLPTDPAKNSTLAQELAQVDTNAISATAKIGQDLLTTGISETGMATSLYNTLLGINQTQTANFAKSIANFAAAFGGGPKIQISGATSTA
jgi:hypothetical protein